MHKSTFLLLIIALVGALIPPFSDAQQKKKNGAFAAIEDDPSLPRALIIGDSISIGYTLATREALAGKVNLHRIPTNAGHTGMGIAGLPKWLAEKNGRWDVIHFNFGLWDLCYRHPDSKTQGKRDKVNGTVTLSVEEYRANLDTIVTELKKTGAQLVFATTTPVPEEEAGRKVGDDLTYNKAAVEVMQKHGVAINDLHSVMAGKMEQYAVKPGDVHYKAEGSEILARKVADAILEALPGGEPVVLYDGKNFDHWNMEEPGGWIIEADGAMTCLMKEVEKKGKKRTVGRGDLWSKKMYGDFELSVKYKLSEGANSGIFYRTNIDDPVQDGFELQLMDNVGFQKTHGEKEDRKLNGSFYDCLAPSRNPQNPIGEWNDVVIHCKGPRIQFTINGVQVIDVNVNDWTESGKNPDGTPNKFKKAVRDKPRVGAIGLQNHGQKVWFKDIAIREL